MNEHSLDGSLRSVRGALPIAIEARRTKVKRLIVPEVNVAKRPWSEALRFTSSFETESGERPFSWEMKILGTNGFEQYYALVILRSASVQAPTAAPRFASIIVATSATRRYDCSRSSCS